MPSGKLSMRGMCAEHASVRPHTRTCVHAHVHAHAYTPPYVTGDAVVIALTSGGYLRAGGLQHLASAGREPAPWGGGAGARGVSEPGQEENQALWEKLPPPLECMHSSSSFLSTLLARMYSTSTAHATDRGSCQSYYFLLLFHVDFIWDWTYQQLCLSNPDWNFLYNFQSIPCWHQAIWSWVFFTNPHMDTIRPGGGLQWSHFRVPPPRVQAR